MEQASSERTFSPAATLPPAPAPARREDGAARLAAAGAGPAFPMAPPAGHLDLRGRADRAAAEPATGRDLDRVLREWNDTAAPLPEVTVPELFERQVAATPDAVALEIGGDTLSYARLSARANRLADRLTGCGVWPGDAVGVLMERSADRVAALLAVAKAGAAYVPLDPRSPAARMDAILRAVGSGLVMVDESHREHEVTSGRGSLPVERGGGPEGEPGPYPAPPAAPGALLYVQPTGPTYALTGVEITHRNVVALARDRAWRGAAHRRVLLHSPPASGAATYEVWVPLLTGGRVVVSPGGLDATLTRRLAGAGRITGLFLPAYLFGALAEDDPSCLDGVREVWTGGYGTSPEAVDEVAAACPGITIVNAYGPTEGTAFAVRHRVPRGPRRGALPIGVPMDNTRAYVLDDRLRPLPPGAAGRLYVAGAGVARGYTGRPDLTWERFLPDPYGPPGDRMHATGDLAWWDEDGDLFLLGRPGDRMRMHGFRIEPGEIEAVLARRPQVAAAVDRL